MDVSEVVREHERLFNAAVRSGDFSAFVATFGDDAVMTFEGVPVGPFLGREAIRDAYAHQPPTDTMTVGSVDETSPDSAMVHFEWDHGTSGTMWLRWADDELISLTIAFDEYPAAP